MRMYNFDPEVRKVRPMSDPIALLPFLLQDYNSEFDLKLVDFDIYYAHPEVFAALQHPYLLPRQIYMLVRIPGSTE